MESSNTGKVLSALLVGAIVGAGVGILFAPDKGSRTRRRLMRSAEGMAGDVKDRIKGEVDNFRDKLEELEDLAEDMIGIGSQGVATRSGRTEAPKANNHR